MATLTRIRFVSVQEVLAMPELGADHITIGIPLLTDLSQYDALPTHQKGQWKKPLRDIPGINEPHFIWANWNPARPDSEERRAKVLADADPAGESMSKDAELASDSVDYLQEGVLDEINQKDEVSRLRLAEGLRRFGLMEEESKKFIQGLQASLA